MTLLIVCKRTASSYSALPIFMTAFAAQASAATHSSVPKISDKLEFIRYKYWFDSLYPQLNYPMQISFVTSLTGFAVKARVVLGSQSIGTLLCVEKKMVM